ncbi:hypothetical protein MLD38_008767 [Melastoma candidum]|uniref:Uncharacterized protein n=1 Tax=Melastoma candidum TaxID=119954 RepID=A0ACB9RVC7_9MYRT|nr:hypothetical protein MLD38_008767 [Melastoma candidum]
MPRYDDRRNTITRLYVGHLSSRTRTRDLEDLFARYGRVRAVDMKRDYAFVEFGDPRDADDARYSLDGREFKGSRIVVEFSRGTPRGPGGSRDYLERGPPPGSGRCFNCGIDGHWARDCKAGDWKNKCYRCGERGHIERNCQNSPKKLREQKYSRSPSPRARGRSRSRSFSRSRSYSRSRSPVKRERERSYDDVERRQRSPDDSRSPPMRDRSPSPRRRDSPGLCDKSPRGRTDLSPDERKWDNGSDYGNSPRGRSRSQDPMNDAEAAADGNYRSPVEENGHERSPGEENGHDPSPGEENGHDRSPGVENGNERSPSPIPRDEEGNGGSNNDDDNGGGDNDDDSGGGENDDYNGGSPGRST